MRKFTREEIINKNKNNMIPKEIKYEENLAFISFSNEKEGLLFDDSKHKKYPIRYYNVLNGEGMPDLNNDCSYYAYIYDGSACLSDERGMCSDLVTGMYFSMNGGFHFKTQKSKMIIIEVLHTKGIYPETNYRAMNTVGGRIEERGRLKYIDGCTDSLLIAPVKMGDPCLNHLHFPTDITQTAHTHPSHRIGIVADGHGECVTPFGVLPLIKGMIFVIKEWHEEMDGQQKGIGLDGKEHLAGTHKFDTTDSHMDVIAFHPDSDFGATDIVHPMINRTIVENEDGEFVSAGSIETIRTQ